MSRPLPSPSAVRRAAQAKRQMNAVGPTVQRLRVEKGWSQEALAAKLQIVGWDCTRSWLAKIEARQVLVRDHQLLYLCVVFDVKPEALFSTLDPKKALRP